MLISWYESFVNMMFWQAFFVVIIVVLMLSFVIYKIKKGRYKQMNNSSITKTNTNNGTSSEFTIDIRDLFSKFREHLEINDNKRILFSGKFGIGKTYFLKEFFNNYKEKYEFYYLSLVNYQIGQNEDIIKFIECDILVEILNNSSEDEYNEDEDIKDLSDLQLLYDFAKNNFAELISLIPKLGRPLKEAFVLIKKFKDFEKQAGKGKGDNIVGKFLGSNITETDCISEIIKKKINERKGRKESVLIVDDLDRIDPEHIFRILNVFSAHFDLSNNELPNKFGFDKIIIVADYSNLVKIFHHKYGQDTDASGYFDKFFSVEIFHFTPEEIILKKIDEIISRFQVKDKNLKSAFLEDVGYTIGYARVFLKTILTRALKLTGKEKLNMRQLLKGVRFNLPEFGKNENTIRPTYTLKNSILNSKSLETIIDILFSIFDNDKEHLISVLEKIKQSHFDNDKGHFNILLEDIKQGHFDEINQGKNKEKNREEKIEDNNYKEMCEFFFFNLLLEKIIPKEFERLESGKKVGFTFTSQHSNISYDIQVDPGSTKNVTVSKKTTPSNSDFYEFFYDLLIEYIKQI